VNEKFEWTSKEAQRSAAFETRKIEEYTGLVIATPCEVIKNPSNATVLKSIIGESEGNWLTALTLFMAIKSQDAYGVYLTNKRRIIEFFDSSAKQGDIMDDPDMRYLADMSHVTTHEAGHAWFEDNSRKDSEQRKVDFGAQLCRRMINEGAAITIADRTMMGIVDNEVKPFFIHTPGIQNRERKIKEFEYREGGVNSFKIGAFAYDEKHSLRQDMELIEKIVQCYEKIEVKEARGYIGLYRMLPQLHEFMRAMYRVGNYYVSQKLAEHGEEKFAEVMTMIVKTYPQNIRELKKELGM
jgi:hypothetical protein